MLTPPPSPGFPVEKQAYVDDDDLVGHTPSRCEPPLPMSPDSFKRRIGRRTRWAVIAVPLVLALITASTRYLTHPAAFDVFSETPSWESLSSHAGDWTAHKRHPLPAELPLEGATTLSSQATTGFPTSLTGTGTSSTAEASSTEPPTSQQVVPTIPASAPPLPTPFPQPFDSSLSQNFSSLSCFNFFSNMTNTGPFRTCRPFSLLLQSSAAFIQAQEDLSELNSIVWGTCNTTTTQDECTSNMAWFSSALESQCAIDLKDGNSMAVQTKTALSAFTLLRAAGCLADPATNTYCYLDAVRNSNPSDTYYYSLPLGISVPNNTIASCSACTKSLMGLYYGALTNDNWDGTGMSAGSGVGLLQQGYGGAAKIAVADCGTAYATLITSTGAASSLQAPGRTAVLFAGLLVLVAGAFSP